MVRFTLQRPSWPVGRRIISMLHARAGDRPAGNPRATRSVVFSRHGMIATSQPLASSAGLDVLRQGGNAIDAAITAAAVLSVVEPTMTGIGGDLFALVFDAKQRRVHGLNASGRAGAAASCAGHRRRGLEAMPLRGALSVTVPGVVDGWATLLEKHGTRSLARLLEPAIGYAIEGFPVEEIVAGQWRDAAPAIAADPDAARVFLPAGRAPQPGEVFTNPDLGRSLRQIAAHGADAFYRGDIARHVVEALTARGSFLTADDLAGHRSDWVTPLSTTYRGFEVLELPPNTQGFVALEMLNVLEGFDLAHLGHNSAETLHLLIESKRLAFADRDRYLADPDHVPADRLARLVSKDYAAERRRLIDPSRAAARVAPGHVPPSAAGDTVYLTAADAQGNVVSLIQSLFESFGSAVVAGSSGVVLQNRGALFDLDEAHPNAIGPRKRPFHTLIPAMVLVDGLPWWSFGVMGGDLQPQGHAQVLVNAIDFGMNVQEAGEAARFRHSVNGVALESAIDEAARRGLEARGHTLIDERGVFGGYQGIQIDRPRGVLAGGSDPRKDGQAVGY